MIFKAPLLGLVALSFFMTACVSGSAFDRPAEFSSLQKAVDVNVTTLSVARWEDYAAALQAQFTITPATALAAAVPQTSISQNSVADALSFGLKVGAVTSDSPPTKSLLPPQIDGAPTTGNSGTGSGSAANSSTSGGGAGSGVGSGSNAAGSGSPTPSSAATPSAGIHEAGQAGILVQTDTILSYTAAAAIYQEIQLLNRYILDAALRYGYVPYVVRIQVSVMPFAHNEPYDLYLDMGLFSHCEGRDKLPSPAFAVPLLVTDDIEKGAASAAETVARQLELSVAGNPHGYGPGGNASALSNQIKAALASSFNSLFMVSRGPTDNVLQIRIGAASNPAALTGYTMLAQTHNITFLLLVKQKDAALEAGGCSAAARGPNQVAPVSGPVVDAISVAHLRNVKTGAEIPIAPRSMIDEARKVMDRVTDGDSRVTVSDEQIKALVNRVKGSSDDDLGKLRKDLIGLKIDPLLVEAVWTGLASAASQSEYRSVLFNLPYPTRHQELANQTVFVLDNCKDTATTSLTGLGDIAPGQFMAELQLRDGTYRVAATKVTQSVAGAPWTITFPSLRILVLDVPLQGLVVGRALAVTGTGRRDQKPTLSAAPILVIPIVGSSGQGKTASTP